MRAEARSITTIDGERFQRVAPQDSANFSQWIRVIAGPADEPGEESFDFHVCTPAWLMSEVARTGPIFGRHLVIVDHWDAEALESAVTNFVSEVEGSDWSDVAAKLAHFGHWEFEDYQR